MNPPRFISLDQVMVLHGISLERFKGLDGTREPGLVDSALASAENAFWYGHGDLFGIAAAYAFHLAESQAFFDGNKRTGAAAALVFLELNGIGLPASADLEIHQALIAVAKKTLDKDGLARSLRNLADKGN